jgi:O-antigen/teichoic acid export membrane protein
MKGVETQGMLPSYHRTLLFVVAHNASNVLNYAYLLIISQLLAPSTFALFGALFGAIYLASALANSVQMSTACVVAAKPAAAAEAVAVRCRTFARWTPAFAAGSAAFAWPAAWFLHSEDYSAVLSTAAAIWLFFFASIGYGALQGRERFGLLGTGLIIAAATRLVVGPLLLLAGFGVTGAILGIVAGLALSAAFVLAPFGRPAPTKANAPRPSLQTLLAPLLVSVAIAVPTSIDVVLARHYFDGLEAGTYAAVSVLGKIVVFGPMAVSVSLFPAMVRAHLSGARSLTVLSTSLVATAGVAIPLSALTLIAAVAGSGVVLRGYDASALLVTTYMLAMLAFSLLIPLMYYDLARGRAGCAAYLLAVLGSETIALLFWHPAALAFAVVLLAGNATAGAVILLSRLREARDEGRGSSEGIVLAHAAQTRAVP